MMAMRAADNLVEYWKAGVALSSAVVLYLFGDIGSMLLMLVVLMTADWLTGIIAGYVTGSLSSQRGLRGIAIKFLFPFAVFVAHMGDELLRLHQPVLATATVTVLAANECLSIIENLAEAGVPIPKRLRAALEAIKDKNDTEAIERENVAQR